MVIFDFLIIFVTCILITLFSLENTQDVTLKILPQLEIQVHLAVALVIAMGVGATLAGLYILWIKLKNNLQFTRQKRQIKKREKEIEQLTQNMKNREAELEKLRHEKLESEKENLLKQESDSNNQSVSLESN